MVMVMFMMMLVAVRVEHLMRFFVFGISEILLFRFIWVESFEVGVDVVVCFSHLPTLLMHTQPPIHILITTLIHYPLILQKRLLLLMRHKEPILHNTKPLIQQHHKHEPPYQRHPHIERHIILHFHNYLFSAYHSSSTSSASVLSSAR